MNTLDLAQQKVTLKKAASTHGGEWHGPCPACGGNDRFHVWPMQNEGRGGYWCRGCGKTGDNIQYLIDFEGLDFKSACERLNISRFDKIKRDMPQKAKSEFTPAEHQSPAALWQEKAGKFLIWAQNELDNDKKTLAWLAARGISANAARDAGLGWNPGENGNDLYRNRRAWGLPEEIKANGKPRMLWLPRGLVIPYCPPLAGVAQSAGGGIIQRLRIRRPEGEPRYYVVPGSAMGTMIVGADRQAFVLVESELDAIACAASQELVGAVALGTLEGKPDKAVYDVLKKSLAILNALDFGDTGGGKTAGLRARKWWEENFPQCERWPVPKGKDPGEAFSSGIDLGLWIKEGLPPVMMMGEEGLKVKGEKLNEDKKEEPQPDVVPRPDGGIQAPPEGTPELLVELWNLLKNNPTVRIVNEPDRFTVLKGEKFVGGRINYLVFREKEVTDYLLDHPDAEITAGNLFYE